MYQAVGICAGGTMGIELAEVEGPGSQIWRQIPQEGKCVYFDVPIEWNFTGK